MGGTSRQIHENALPWGRKKARGTPGFFHLDGGLFPFEGGRGGQGKALRTHLPKKKAPKLARGKLGEQQRKGATD